MNSHHVAQCTMEIINNWIKQNSKILSIFKLDNLDFFGIVQGMKGTMKTVSSKVEVEHRVKSPGFIMRHKQTQNINSVDPGTDNQKTKSNSMNPFFSGSQGSERHVKWDEI